MNEVISEYKAQAEIHASIDYSDDSSVRLGNKAADTLRKLGGEKLEKNDLLELIGSEHPASLWSAHHLLELHKPNLEEEKKAEKRIELKISKGGVQAMGERMFLDEYRKNKTR